MREILFRGKRLDNGEWIYGGYQFEHGFGNPSHYIVEYSTFGAFTVNNLIKVCSDTVGQYTGFKDKNGVKIFEGDVVDTHDADNNSNKALIEFEEGYLGIGGAFNDFSPICEFNYNQWEVLGSKEEYGHLVGDIDWEEVR